MSFIQSAVDSIPLPAAFGGTGAASPTAHSLPIAEGAGAFTFIGPLAAGQLLIGTNTIADPAAGYLNAGPGVVVTTGIGSITLSATGTILWSVITAGQTAVKNNGYLANGASQLSVALPATSTVGDTFAVGALNANGWKITQASSQQIQLGATNTTAGTGGSIASTAIGNTVTLVCSVANTNWYTTAFNGNITVV